MSSPAVSANRPRILLLEDNDADATPCLEELCRAGFEADSDVVSSSQDFINSLQSRPYDLILADRHLTGWTGLDALRWLKSSGLGTPLILITRALEDELAVEYIREGAIDCVLKEKLDRLPGACRRALDETWLRAERDRAAKEVIDTGEQYKILFDANPLPLWVFDRETLAFLAVNDSAVRHYGFSRPEFLQMTIREIGMEEGLPASLEAIDKPISQIGGPETWKHRKKNGVTIDVEMTSHGLIFQGRHAELVLIHDITEQNKNLERLRQSEQRFAMAFRCSPLPITISTRADGRFLDVNDAFLKMTGYKRQEVLGHLAEQVSFWQEPQERHEMIQQLTEHGGVAGFETTIRTRWGDVRRVEISAEAIELDGSQCILAITKDVTEGKRLEEQFRQSQKMEAVGRLAGGIAHDFNNMLGVIIGYAELLQERVDSESEHKGVEEIKVAAERAASLTRQLLAFSRRNVVLPRVIDLNEVVHNLSNMLCRMIGEDVELVIAGGAALGRVKADPVQIEQAIINLAVNARDAMPRGGKLIMTTSNADLDEAHVSQHPSVCPGAYVVLSVTDTGCGMSEDTLLHIFEPFYTTKGPGKGTGLGLSMVYGVVSQCGGGVWVYSNPGKGTTFKIYLPRVDEAADVEPREIDHPVVRGSETILLVEDEGSLRSLVASLLESNGYVVLQAAHSEQAISLAKSHDYIDLLMTDVIMPGQNGVDLAAALRNSLPNLKLLYMSGYTGDLITQYGVLDNEVTLLEKPFTRSSLLSKVRTVLDRQVIP